MLNIVKYKKITTNKNITKTVRSLLLYINKRSLFLSRLSKLILSYNCKSDRATFFYVLLQQQERKINRIIDQGGSSIFTVKLLIKKLNMVEKLIRLFTERVKILRLEYPFFCNQIEQLKPDPEPIFEEPEKQQIEYGEFMLFLKKRKNNFYINLHLYNGKLLYTGSVGKVHFKGPKRSTMYGLEELAKKTSTFLATNKINYVRIFITSKVNKRVNRVIKLLKYNYPKLRYIVNKVIKYQHSAGLKLKKLRRV